MRLPAQLGVRTMRVSQYNKTGYNRAMEPQWSRTKLLAWQAFFLLLSTSWLLAPALNHELSYRLSLISQYETSGEPYALFFRISDVAGALLLIWLVLARLRFRLKQVPAILLIAAAIGMLLDPILATVCTSVVREECHEGFTISWALHATETTVTATAIAALALYDAITERWMASVLFITFQIVYGMILLSGYTKTIGIDTLTQFIYQAVVVLWLAWYCRKHLLLKSAAPISPFRISLVRRGLAGWVLVNGLLAIIVSLAHIRLLGNIKGLYFVGNYAWLAQHAVIVGVIMLYLSRHLLRGEMRARQILLIIVGIETLQYAAITPNFLLVSIYATTFTLLFITSDDFRRGALPMTRQVRLKDLAYMLTVLLTAALLATVVLDRDNRVARVADRAYVHFTQYALHADEIHMRHREAVLLANTATAFLFVSAGVILWILFKPYKVMPHPGTDVAKVTGILHRYSRSTEDYFKTWPLDKQYFLSGSGDGFIAYKLVGPVAFALADPISPLGRRQELIAAFVTWCQVHRLRACFVAAPEDSLPIYEGMNVLQIGASALIDTKQFTETTMNDKWWRWKRNRALKEGYHYNVHKAPHPPEFMHALRNVSNSWLGIDEHKERGFALGYFDTDYLDQCEIHYLQNESGEVVAFANRLPSFRNLPVASIDLLRYRKDASDAMPFLLSNVVEASRAGGYKYFDLGFVPFAGVKGPLFTIARMLSAGRFSSQGLEQFKNKFDPEWKNIYLVYDGDVTDLALIALNLERAMELGDEIR